MSSETNQSIVSQSDFQMLGTRAEDQHKRKRYQIGVMNMGQNLKLCQECLGCLESHLLDGQLLQSQDKKRI
jgi:hypothetical protein